MANYINNEDFLDAMIVYKEEKFDVAEYFVQLKT